MGLTPPKWPSKMENAFNAVVHEFVEMGAIDWGEASEELKYLMNLFIAPLIEEKFKVKISK